MALTAEQKAAAKAAKEAAAAAATATTKERIQPERNEQTGFYVPVTTTLSSEKQYAAENPELYRGINVSGNIVRTLENGKRYMYKVIDECSYTLNEQDEYLLYVHTEELVRVRIDTKIAAKLEAGTKIEVVKSSFPSPTDKTRMIDFVSFVRVVPDAEYKAAKASASTINVNATA